MDLGLKGKRALVTTGASPCMDGGVVLSIA
jgi:hypothetical protein